MKLRTLLASFASLSLLALVGGCGDVVDLGGETQPTPKDDGTGSAVTQQPATGSKTPSTPQGESDPVTDPQPESGGFSFGGNIRGEAPTGSKVVVVWQVSSGSPDYTFSFGGGSIAGLRVNVSFGTEPPTEALNDGQLGVGFVALVDDAIPEGKFSWRDLESSVRYVSPDHAIIFRKSGSSAISWESAFPTGYACGRCVRNGTTFDDFAPTSCKNVNLVPLTADVKICNWT